MFPGSKVTGVQVGSISVALSGPERGKLVHEEKITRSIYLGAEADEKGFAPKRKETAPKTAPITMWTEGSTGEENIHALAPAHEAVRAEYVSDMRRSDASAHYR